MIIDQKFAELTNLVLGTRYQMNSKKNFLSIFFFFLFLLDKLINK